MLFSRLRGDEYGFSVNAVSLAVIGRDNHTALSRACIPAYVSALIGNGRSVAFSRKAVEHISDKGGYRAFSRFIFSFYNIQSVLEIELGISELSERDY